MRSHRAAPSVRCVCYIIPYFFPVTRESDSRDGFAGDCPLQRGVMCEPSFSLEGFCRGSGEDVRLSAHSRGCPITPDLLQRGTTGRPHDCRRGVRALSVQSDCPDTDLVAKLIDCPPGCLYRRPRSTILAGSGRAVPQASINWALAMFERMAPPLRKAPPSRKIPLRRSGYRVGLSRLSRVPLVSRCQRFRRPSMRLLPGDEARIAREAACRSGATARM